MTTLGRREKCLRNRSEKGHFRELHPHQRETVPPGTAGNTVDQTIEKPLNLYAASWNRRVLKRMGWTQPRFLKRPQ